MRPIPLVFEPCVPIHVPELPLPEAVRFAAPGIHDFAGRRRLSIYYVIHQFYPDGFTGTEKFVLHMARVMLQRGHRVKVITYSARGLEEFPHDHGNVVHKEYDYEGVPVLAFRHKMFDPVQTSGVGHPDLFAFASFICMQERPDLLHIGHPMRGLEWMAAALQAGIPYIVTLTDFWFICPKSTLVRNNGQLCEGPENGEACSLHCQISEAQARLQSHTALLRAARKILAPSAFVASMMNSVLPDVHVEVISHGIRYETIVPNRRRYKTRSRRPLVLIFAGYLAPHKGAHVIIEALTTIPAAQIRLKIYGAGDEEYVRKLQAAAAVDPRVELCGPYTEHDIHRMYLEADVSIVPSLVYENYPLVLHEALASHVPAIVSGAGGMAEKVWNGVNGFTFRMGDVKHLARRIVQLVRRPNVLNVFKTNIRTMPIPSVDHEASAYESIYYIYSEDSV